MTTEATISLKLHKTARTGSYTWERVQRDIRANYARTKSLRAVAHMYGVNHAVIQRALLGQEPTKPHARHALGLPPLIPAPACVECGEVHVTRRCPKKAKRQRPRRIAIRTDDMKSAARTILRNLADEQINELLAILEGYYFG